MRTYLLSLTLLILLLSLGCDQKTQTPEEDLITPTLVAMYVGDIEETISWYSEKLGFEIEKDIEEFPDYGMKIAFLRFHNFHLEIIEKEGAAKQSEVLPDQDTYLGGVLKLGFKVSDIAKTYTHLQSFQDVQFETEVGELPTYDMDIEWPSKYFLVQDPDGNLIQFFDKGTTEHISPWLIMIVVANLENASDWYMSTLGFEHHMTVGEKGVRRVSILERDGCVLEMYEPKQTIPTDSIPADSAILGFKKLAFGVNHIDTLSQRFEKSKTNILFPIDKVSNFDWANRHMIVKDFEGNWVQVYEISTETSK